MSSLVYKLLLSLCLCLRHYRGYVYGSSSYHAPHVKDGLHNWGVIAWLLWTTDSPHVLLFTVDRDTHEFFCRLQSNVFDAASLFQTNLVSRGTLKCTTWGHFFCVASRLCRITWCSVSKINVCESSQEIEIEIYLFVFKRKAYRAFCLP